MCLLPVNIMCSKRCANRSGRAFVCRADVVPDIDRDQRQRAVLRQDDLETVGQAIFLVGDARRRLGGSDGRLQRRKQRYR